MAIKRTIWILLFSILFVSHATHKKSLSQLYHSEWIASEHGQRHCQDTDGYIWFATQVGAARFDGYDFEYLTMSNGLPNNFVNCLLATRNGDVWFGTEGGIARYDGSAFRIYDEKAGLVNNRVDRMEEDLEGNVWAVSAYGISVISSDTIVSYTKRMD